MYMVRINAENKRKIYIFQICFFLQYVNILIFSLSCDLFAKPPPKVYSRPITAANIQETAVLYKSD